MYEKEITRTVTCCAIGIEHICIHIQVVICNANRQVMVYLCRLVSARYLGFDHTATLFHIRDSPVDPVDKPIYLTNTFSFSIRIHNVSLPAEAKTMFNVSARTGSAVPKSYRFELFYWESI